MWIAGPAFGESSPSSVLVLVFSVARPHSSMRFDVMFGLQPNPSSMFLKYSKVSQSFRLLGIMVFYPHIHVEDICTVHQCGSLKFPALSGCLASHTPLFLLLLIGKLSFHISKRNLVSASDQLGHRFQLTDPLVGLFLLLLLVLVEDAGEDAEEDVLRRDVAGINCRVFVLKSGYCREISKVLAEEMRDLIRPEEL